MAEPVLERLRAALAGRRDVRLALVFGSTARGTDRPSSDIDLAIEGTADPIALSAQLSLVTGRDVDVVDLRAASIPLLRAIVRDGVVVHERDRGAEGEFRSRALAALDIDVPWYERMRRAYLERVAREGL